MTTNTRKVPSSKLQAPTSGGFPTTNLQTSNAPHRTFLGPWWLKFLWMLALGVWCFDLSAQTNPAAYNPPERMLQSKGVFEGRTARPLRYTPVGTDFVITNGMEFFNRPLYCMNTAFRADCGDKPEFSLYGPGRNGNVRFGVKTSEGAKWLYDASQIVTRYRPGSMVYEIRDPLLGGGVLNLTVLSLAESRGIITRAEIRDGAPVELFVAYGGANGERFPRSGDIGCMPQPVTEAFQLKPEQCRGDSYTISSNAFNVHSPRVKLDGVFSSGAKLSVADAAQWNDPQKLLSSAGAAHTAPVLLGQVTLQPGRPDFACFQLHTTNSILPDAAALPHLFHAAEERRLAIAERVVVETPDPFINAAVAALNVASDGIWDEATGTYQHGAVAWRSRLLGWRGPYTGDALGWHDRARRHFKYWAGGQITDPIPDKIPPADPTSNLSRNEPALHSNGALSKSHYDMNLVYIDALFRHFQWTGDTNFAAEVWPVIERHLAWERRLFRREFGDDKLPLYEAYAAIWASDDLQYHGGGATHTSAYNLWHNKMAARMARILGKDAAPYEREAELISRGMKQNLWLSRQGWFAEWKDYLGLQSVHPNAALWTFYHTIDSEAATPMEAWQMTRFVDTQNARIPVHGPGVPDENLFTLPTTSWMPYRWSINNVVMAEVAHTSLAYWQANRPDVAFRIFKGALLDSMFLGLCPGNSGMTTHFDMARGEAQRDFGDSVGINSRVIVEGLFGVHPDVLAGEIVVRPGLPAQWDRARMKHPDFNIAFKREGLAETYVLDPRFPRPMALRLQVAALRDQVAEITVNGRPAQWRALEDSVGVPRIEIQSDAAPKHEVVLRWKGSPPSEPIALKAVKVGGPVEANFGEAAVIEIADSQKALGPVKRRENGFLAEAVGVYGNRTAFAKLKQGALTWWQPVTFEIRDEALAVTPLNWSRPVPHSATFETVDLSQSFNDSVTQIFRNEYLTPRSPFCSLALPKQGIGSWCHYAEEFDVDDSGLRSVAAKNGGKFTLPNGLSFRTPGDTGEKNILFTSQWDNYPDAATIPLNGKAKRAFLLMAGSSNPMQSRFDNGEVIVTYADGSTDRLALHNPTTWWPINEDYFIDDFAFRRPEAIPPRVDLKTGEVRILDLETFKGKGGKVPGGAATVLDLPLDSGKELKSLTVRTLANEVVIGLMAVTLERD
ncbi:MAG TPA: DUF4450 domain-containing protein [Verrucomicrobiota bacterium]|nr:DUF4450 domain-containing protein [Verrucomicrobiota bacterium]